MNIMNMPITGLKGIGPKKAEQFYKKGINCVYDLLSYLPSRYEDRGTVSFIENLTVGESVCIKAKITSPVRVMRIRKSLTITRTTVADDSGEIILCWYNQKYIDKALKYDEYYTFFGKISKGRSGLEMVNPVLESMDKEGKYTGKIIPVYHGIMPISQKGFISAQETALEQGGSVLVSFLPEALEKKYNLLNVYDATKNIHFPENEEMLIKARERFAFEKFFHFQTAMRMLRSKEKEKGIIFSDVNTDEFEKNLPFNLTNAQKKVIDAVKMDLISGKASKRLVQGDVGSGKTVVAVIMAYLAVKNGYQATIMAPTEILAKQHFITFSKMLPDLKIECLTSSVTKKNKELICEKLSKGEIDILIGTHALIEDNVVFDAEDSFILEDLLADE
ncbi:MAG: DEAD/DEAH box helicase [Clostridia bacterium]|nr:DEAD/DEAH box helicase [Clostridia bacterium]